MAGEDVAAIPVIDLRDFSHAKLVEACEEWGCFRLVNHEVPLPLMMEMKAVVRALLDRPTHVKTRNVDVIAGSGYMPPSAVNPLYEALGLYDMASSPAVDDFASQLDATPHQRNIIKNFAKAIHELAMDLAQKLAAGMGLVEYQFKEWPSQFRINKYSFTPETVGTSGVQIHTDSGFLTILQDDEDVGGLEVMDKCGRFIPVNVLPGSFVVNLGDIAKAWSNGRLCNVQHRVQCKEAKVRISIASFLLGPKGTVVEAPSELISSENPRQYVPFTFEEYRKLRITTKLQAGQALELVRAKPHVSCDTEVLHQKTIKG
ncbi:unnamed protein product [Rhodiola kirilowii]